MTLLLVDDEKITIQGMLDGIVWKNCGITKILTAYSAEQAKEILTTHQVQILLCDIEMPGENGIELLRWVRQNDLEIQCALLTCHAEFIYAKEAVGLGCTDYLLKPLAYSEIEELILKMVRQMNKQSDNREIVKYGEQWIKEKTEEGMLLQGRQLSGKEIVEDTVSYIINHLSDELSVAMLAERVFLSSDYLNRLFKKYKEDSVNHYIINERMRLASQLLKNHKLTANVVSYMVGYESYSNFVSMFKKIYGVSPAHYKETQEAGSI